MNLSRTMAECLVKMMEKINLVKSQKRMSEYPEVDQQCYARNLGILKHETHHLESTFESEFLFAQIVHSIFNA